MSSVARDPSNTLRSSSAEKKNLRAWLSVAALANYGVTVWHADLAKKVNPALPAAEAVRIAALAGVLTLVGMVLLWSRRQKTGSLVLVAVFIVGLVIGTAEHFLVAGPNNVFDVGNTDWADPVHDQRLGSSLPRNCGPVGSGAHACRALLT